MSYHIGDTAPDLTGRLTTNGAPKDITGASLEVHVKRPTSAVINRAGTIVTPLTGDWSMPLQVGDLAEAGVYEVEVQVTYAGGKIQTFGSERFYVGRQIA